MYCWLNQWLMLQLTLGEMLHMESWTFTENLIKVQLSASPWRRRTPESRRPHWDIYAASPGRPRCTARPSEDEFWAETERRWGKTPDGYLNRHCNYGFLSALPLLGEVLQVLLHAAVQRVKTFDVQSVQHLRLTNSVQNTVAGWTLRAWEQHGQREVIF